jgi:hypothetical protein
MAIKLWIFRYVKRIDIKMKNIKLEIIDGAGVAATNKILVMMENFFTQHGAFRDTHHPEVIVYYATQAPSRSLFLEGKGGLFYLITLLLEKN